MAQLTTMVGLLRAAGENTRLRLLALLAQGEHTVKDLTEILGQSQPRISRHLKLLADAGLIERNAEGAWAYYRLADAARLDWVQAQQQEQAAAYFAKVADSWDVLRNLHVPDSAVEEAILEHMGTRKVELLLDLGTGTGRMLELLAGHFRRGIGIDSSREMLGVARAKLAVANVTAAQVRLGDIANLDPSLGTADLIVLHQVMHYFDDPGRLLAEIRPALKDDGELLVVDFAPHDLEFLRLHHAHRRLGMSDTQMALWAGAAGLVAERLRTFPNTDAEGLTVCLWRLTADISAQRSK